MIIAKGTGIAVAFLLVSFGIESRCLAADARPGRVSATLSSVAEGRVGDVQVEADRLEQTREGDTVLEGSVTLHFQQSRMQADRISFRQKRTIEAEGNVLMVWEGNRISGTRMSYDLESDHGVIENAIGQVDPEFFFWADRAETVGRDLVKLESATVTTCTQPIPYWSFSVSKAKVRIGSYAHLWNLRLKAGKVPVLYLPYLLWPVKKDRAAGLLFPELGTTRDRGRVLTQGLFLPMGQSADVTLFGEYYTIAGYGGGGEFRWAPNDKGVALLNGFYIQDRVYGGGRYRVTYRQTQEFLNGFRMVADVNQVSDFDFFTDFERELRLASSPTILGRVEFTRNGEWTSVNIRDVRREQLFFDGSSLVQRALPDVEWRGRSRRMGRTPVYVSFESSAAWIQQFGDLDADYFRADLYPTLSVPVSQAPWLDITPSVAYRATWYSQHLSHQPDGSALVEDNSLMRSVGRASVEIIGPKFSRIFQRADDPQAPKYKHTFEPRLAYTYQQGADNALDVLVYDEVDRIISAQNLFSYGLRTRVFTRRPRAEQPMASSTSTPIVFPDGGSSAASGPLPFSRATSDAVRPSRTQEPLEILSFEINQARSIDQNLSSLDIDGDGLAETSRYSPILASGRYSPSEGTDLDARVRYNVIAQRISEFNVAGNLRGDMLQTNFSFVRRVGLGFVSGMPASNETQMRLAAGLSLLEGKLRIGTQGTYVFHPPEGQQRNPDRLWRMEYYTQCCGFLAEYLSRDFSATNTRQELRFTVDLRGIGKLIDVHEGQDR